MARKGMASCLTSERVRKDTARFRAARPCLGTNPHAIPTPKTWYAMAVESVFNLPYTPP